MLIKPELRNLFMILIIAVGSLVGAPVAKAKEIAGVVTSVSGTWLVDGVKVSLGQKLSVGAVIQAKEPNEKYARVVVMLLDFTEKSRICDRRGFCGDPLRLPDVVNREKGDRSNTNQRAPAFWERFVTAITMSSELRYKRTLARGGSNISDQVVRLSNGKVDLAPVFKGTAARKYLISIEDLTNIAGQDSEWIVERRPVAWKGNGSVILKVSNLKPALYRIMFSLPDGERGAVPADVWVLVVEASRYARVSAAYEVARSAVSGWDRKTDPQANEVLRAFLESLLSERKP